MRRKSNRPRVELSFHAARKRNLLFGRMLSLVSQMEKMKTTDRIFEELNFSSSEIDEWLTIKLHLEIFIIKFKAKRGKENE